ncbi:MAG: amidohydrolase family protein [Thermoleophilia bacterium]|nr:amidohydrolase [Gaiellaceae bacterium]MDW8339425.1 amidohydrolase family protein [Thermoleophilia bacterium]
MTTYDVHQHLWPASFVEELRRRRRPPLLDGDVLVTAEGRFSIDLRAHDPEERLCLLDRDGIDVAVLSLQTTLGLEQAPPEERLAVEEAWVAGIEEIVAMGGGRFLAFSPTRARDGFAGISLAASTLLDLDRASSILTEAAASELPVFVHPDGSPAASPGRPPWWEWVVGYPARMQAAYFSWLASGRARWPTLRIAFAMLAGGGPFQLERRARHGLDVRSVLDAGTFLEVSSYGRRAIELCIETFGLTQLLYGSDAPVLDPGPTLDAVRGFGDAVVHVLQSDAPSTFLR